MGTIVVYAVIAIAVAAAIVALLVLILPNDTLARAPADVVPLGLPIDREVDAEDLNRMRLPVTVRGYRMVDADAVFDRLSAEIARRDQEIAELRRATAPAFYGRPDSAAADAEADEVALADVDPSNDSEELDRHGHAKQPGFEKPPGDDANAAPSAWGPTTTSSAPDSGSTG